MKFKRDVIDRYVATDYDGVQLHLDVRTDGDEPCLLIYHGHDHYAVNDKIEALDVSSELTIEDVDALICALMDISGKMEVKK